MAQTISVLSLKGGTGKTTTVRTLTDVFRRLGLDVLAIDLDPQGNLSDYFDVPPAASPTIADVLAGNAKFKDATHDGVVPATPLLGLRTGNDLVADDCALRPFEAQHHAKQGGEGAHALVEQPREYYSHEREWLGVLLNIADMHTVHYREAFAQLKEHFGKKVFD